jgi:hypothetical protein
MSTPATWIIGADSDCDIVIDQATVSGRHCRLTLERDGYWLEDLGSTNGTFVNGERLVARRTVSRSDRITLGQSTPLPWPSHDPSSASPQESLTADRGGVLPWTSNRKTAYVLTAAVACTVTVAILSTVFLMRGKPELPPNPESPVANSDPKDAAGNVSPKVAETQRAASETKSDEPSHNAPPAKPNAGLSLAPDDPARALYFVVIGDLPDTERYQVGTACAVDAHRLLTSASIVAAADKLSHRFPKLMAVSVDGATTLQIQSRKVHPEFQAAAGEVELLKQRLENLQDADLAPAAGRPAEKSAPSKDQLTAEFQKLQEQGRQLAKTMLVYDIAILEVSETLPHTLSLDVSARPASGETLSLIGVPADNESLIFTSKAMSQIRRESVQVTPSPAAAKDERQLHCVCSAEQLRLNWVGSPYLNKEKKVVGVYCRPTPSDDPLAPPLPDRSDASWADFARGL